MAKTFSKLSVGSTIYLRNYQIHTYKNGKFKGNIVKIRCSPYANNNQFEWDLTTTITHIEEYGNELIISYKTQTMNHTIRVNKTSTVGRFYKNSGLQLFDYYVSTNKDFERF